MRTPILSSLLLAAVGVFPVLVACGGREVSLGTNKTQLSQVDPHTVGGNVPSCGGGDAHPNVCCEAGAGKAGTCGVYLGAPFQPCDTGWTTYPDPRSCCALDDPQNCVAPPPTPPPPPPGVCGYACEPGWYPIQNGCCQSTSNGDGVCYGWASGGHDGGTAPDAGIDDGGLPALDGGHCHPFSVDGGISCSTSQVINDHCYVIGCGPAFGNGGCGCMTDTMDSPASVAPPNVCDPVAFEHAWTSVCHFPTASPPPPPPSPEPPPCDYACPAGWQHPIGTPDVCCRDVGGQIECFSQATGPSQGGSGGGDGGTTTTDADVPPSVDAGMAPD